MLKFASLFVLALVCAVLPDKANAQSINIAQPTYSMVMNGGVLVKRIEAFGSYTHPAKTRIKVKIRFIETTQQGTPVFNSGWLDAGVVPVNATGGNWNMNLFPVTPGNVMRIEVELQEFTSNAVLATDNKTVNIPNP
jgi:hypothetical protein